MRKKYIRTVVIICILVGSFGCRENPNEKARHLSTEIKMMQNATLRSILENDLKFSIDLDDQEKFLNDLKKDLDTYAELATGLEDTPSAPDISHIRENNRLILEIISDREEQIKRYRHAGRLIREGEAASVRFEENEDGGISVKPLK